MKATVLRVTASKAGKPTVLFGTAVGTGLALWASEKHSPQIGVEYDVELDLNVPLGRDAVVGAIQPGAPRLTVDGNDVVLRGQVEAVEDDGLGYLRLSDDCLIMADTDGTVNAGETVELRLRHDSLSVSVVGVQPP